MKEKLSNEAQEVLQEILYDESMADEIDILPKRPPGFGVTALEIAEKYDCDLKLAKKKLDEKVKAGKYDCIKMRSNNHNTLIYFRVGEEHTNIS